MEERDTKSQFVVLGDSWASHPISTQHLVLKLAETHPLLYVNMVGLRPPRLSAYDARLIWRKAAGVFSRMPKPLTGTECIHFCSPFQVPYNQFGFLRRRNKLVLQRAVKRRMQELNFTSPILMVSYPCGADVVGELDERILIYYITDQFAAMPGVNPSYAKELERVLLERADLIFVTSAKLQEEKRGTKASPILLPHGVDFKHFHSAVSPLGPVPRELNGLRRPLFGFFGLLAPWVDMDLLDYVSRAFPDASVVLIGPKWFDCPMPKGRPNIYWLGGRSYTDLPRFAAHFDVGLIPFRKDTLTDYVNPLKLLEYLALGLPVVSTPLPDLGNFAGLVHEATSPEQFCGFLELALSERTPGQRSKRFVRSSAESWDSRVGTMLQHIHAALEVKAKS